MTQIPEALNFVQEEAVAAYAPDSESTLYNIGASMNYLLNRYPQPPGIVLDFAGLEASVPTGFLICDGRTFSRTTYASLFATIGTLFGAGDGFTTANTPDLRGLFTRMVDQTSIGSAGRDPDALTRTPLGSGGPGDPGSFEADQFASHAHPWSVTQSGASPASVPNTQSNGDYSLPVYTGAAGGNETRPKNIYMFKIIKT